MKDKLVFLNFLTDSTENVWPMVRDWLYYHGRWYECKSCQLWDHTILSHYESEFVVVPPGPTTTPPEVEVGP